MPFFVKGHDVNVGVGNICANDFYQRAATENLVVVGAEFFSGGPDGGVVFFGQIVDFVAF